MATHFSPSVTARDPSATRRYLLLHRRGLVARRDGGHVAPFATEAEVAALGLDAGEAHVLGELDGDTVVTIPTEIDKDAVPAGYEILGLRSLAGEIDPALFGVVGRAFHVFDWATTSRFCGRCGAKTERDAKERCTRCPACRHTTYPRIAPAVIVLVRKGDLALLASNAQFPGLFYSTLAGFSEIGESLEETLAREVEEEAGVRVKNARYFGSQPWPFPHSLMIGFTAEWESGEIRIDPAELSDAKWFSARELPVIPPPLSIARRLIDAWVAEITGA